MSTLALSRKLTIGALALATAAIASGSAALLTGGCHHAEPSAQAPPPRANTGALSASSKGPRGRAEAPGLKHVYAVRFDQDVGFVSRGDKSANAAIKLLVTGNLSLAFVGADGDQHRLYGALENVRLEVSGAREEETLALALEMQKPFYVTAHPDGRVRGYAFARGLSPTAANMVRGLVGASQFAAREEASFSAAEDDIHGSYRATYARSASGEVKKTKGRYDRIATMTTLVPSDRSMTVETGGESVAKLDESGWLTALSVDEKKKATLGENMPMATTHIRLDMKVVRTTLDPALLGRFAEDKSALTFVGPYGTGDEASGARASDQKLVGDRSVDDLTSIVGATSDDQERGRLSEQLSARFRLTPPSTERAVELARKLPARDGQLLASALASAETPESIRALGSIANEKGTPVAVRAQAATALAFAGKSADARDPLLQAMGDGSREVRESAALALGNVARELGGESTAVTELVHGYRDATTDEERVTFLRALGNSGDPEVLTLAREALMSRNEALREAAAHALRFLPLGEADVLLDATLAADESENVREASVDAMGFRVVERHAAALVRALDTDGSRKVKAEIVTVVSRALAVRGATLSQQGRAILTAVLQKADPHANASP